LLKKRILFTRFVALLLISMLVIPMFGIQASAAVTLSKELTLYMVPNTHLDTAWQHPFPQVANNTSYGIRPMFTNSTTALKQGTQYRFTTSASAHLRMLKDYYNMDNPTTAQRLWNDVVDLVDKGQIDLAGGQIVEPDLNIPSGEALVRQSLYAQHFFLKNFTLHGEPYYARTGMVPDVFGFSGQIPQILFKSQMWYFVTSKVNWNGQSAGSSDSGAAIGSSYDHFRSGARARDSDIQTWQALDGKSTVIANFLQNDYNNTSVSNIQAIFDANWVTTTTNDASGFPNSQNFHGGVRSTGIKKALAFYGGGDFGQGMTGGIVTTNNGNSFGFHTYVAANQGSAINVRSATVTEFFDDLVATENLERINTTDGNYIEGEMYAEFHRGTYTTWARLKKYNRDNEILGESAEKAATIGFYTNSLTTNSADRIEEGWYKILINQMHDVLPGAALAWQSYLTFNQQELAKNLFTNVRNNALAALAYRADTNVQGKPIFVYNSLSWKRNGEVTVSLKYDELPTGGVVIYDGTSAIYPSNILRDRAKKTLTVTFMAEDVPATGYKVFDARLETAGSRTTPLKFDEATWTIENNNIKMKLNPATGYISSLQTIINGAWQEMFVQGEGTEGGELHIYRDCDTVAPSQSFHQWEVNIDELNKEPDFIITGVPLSMEVTCNTPEKVTVSVEKEWNGAAVIQEYTLHANSERVDVHLKANWFQPKRLLKVSFPILADNNYAAYETSFGAVERPTLRDNLFGRARFEVPMHKWADVSDKSGGWGVSIINDAKYGNDSLRKVTAAGVAWVRNRITVCRVPVVTSWASNSSFPPQAQYTVDSSVHEINYAIYPHAGSWKDAATVNQGYEVNNPMTAFEAAKNTNVDWASSKSFASTNKPNVIISALKNQYDEPTNNNKIVVRVYEATGRDTNGVTITLPGTIVPGSAKEVNMLEHDFTAANGYTGRTAYTTKALTVSGDTVSFDIGKYEALTIQVELAPSSLSALAIPQESVSLAYNSRGVTGNANRREGFFEGTGASTSNTGRSFPQEYWPANNKINYQGIEFSLGAADANNFLNGTAGNSTVSVSTAGKYSKVYIVGASANSSGGTATASTPFLNNAVEGVFTVNYTDGTSVSKNITFNSWRTHLSSWNNLTWTDDKPYVYDSIAFFSGHHHTSTGTSNSSEIFECECYLFVYDIDIDDSKTVASIDIPQNSLMKIAAITLADPVDGFGEVHQYEIDDEFYWNFSDSRSGASSGNPVSGGSLNISGELIPVYRNFASINSAGTTLTGTEGANQILTNNGSSKWCNTSVNANNAWFIMDAGSQVTSPGYVIRGANDDMSYTSRVLHSWTVQGSNSASGPWTTISTESGRGSGWTSNYQTRQFSFIEGSIPEEGFRYYRLQITRIATSTNGTALGTSNTTVQFSYFGLVGGYTENGVLEARTWGSAPAKDGSFSITNTNGRNVLAYEGNVATYVSGTPVQARSSASLRSFVNVLILPDTKFSYMFNPINSISANMAIDIKFSDGTYLKNLSSVDQNGVSMLPANQGAGKAIGQWNHVVCDIGKYAAGKIVSEILIGFEHADATPGERIEGYFDDIRIYKDNGIFNLEDGFINFMLDNDTSFAGDVKVFSAVYDSNGRMVDSGISSAFSVAANSTAQFAPDIVLDTRKAGSDYNVKLFLWTADDFIPLAVPFNMF